MNQAKRTVVFDLDGSLETPYYGDNQETFVRTWMKEHPCGYDYEQLYVSVEACGQTLPHFIFPGGVELLRWVHDRGFDIVFFSNAVAERNKALCPIIMERAFGKGNIPPYRILSREDCVNTTTMDDKGDTLYQGLWHGNYKKKLAGVVIGAQDLPQTIMVEDDNSYACKGEERNFVYGVYGGCAERYLDAPELSEHGGQDFHLPFYFCGMLKRILECAAQDGVSLAEASVRVQYEDRGFLFPSDGVRRVSRSGSYVEPPCPPQKDYRIYHEGLVELRQYNPDLKFWSAAKEEEFHWPYIPSKPIAPPKPKVKTEMSMEEARYWLSLLREILCAVKMDNIKYVILRSDDHSEHATSDESGAYVKPRHPPFGESDWFDVKKVSKLTLGGYLPNPQSDEESKSFDRTGYSHLGYVHAGTQMFAIFRRVIENFLRDVFRLSVDWSTIDRSLCEQWTVTVRPID